MSDGLLFQEVLNTLIGKTIRVFRGGPESKQGRVLSSMEDYFAVLSSETVVYYQTLHVQNITEDAKESALFLPQDEEVLFHTSKTFVDLLKEFIAAGTTVKVNLGGPESRAGIIIDAGFDFVALFTKEDGVVFYNLEHVKSVSEKAVYPEPCPTGKRVKPVDSACVAPEYIIPPYPHVSRFSDLFCADTTPWVSINRGGPHALEGILVSCNGFLKIINNHEIFHVHLSHIKSFNLGMKGSGKKVQQILLGEDSSEESSDNSNNTSNNNNQSTTFKRRR